MDALITQSIQRMRYLVVRQTYAHELGSEVMELEMDIDELRKLRNQIKAQIRRAKSWDRAA